MSSSERMISVPLLSKELYEFGNPNEVPEGFKISSLIRTYIYTCINEDKTTNNYELASTVEVNEDIVDIFGFSSSNMRRGPLRYQYKLKEENIFGDTPVPFVDRFYIAEVEKQSAGSINLDKISSVDDMKAPPISVLSGHPSYKSEKRKVPSSESLHIGSKTNIEGDIDRERKVNSEKRTSGLGSYFSDYRSIVDESTFCTDSNSPWTQIADCTPRNERYAGRNTDNRIKDEKSDVPMYKPHVQEIKGSPIVDPNSDIAITSTGRKIIKRKWGSSAAQAAQTFPEAPLALDYNPYAKLDIIRHRRKRIEEPNRLVQSQASSLRPIQPLLKVDEKISGQEFKKSRYRYSIS